MKTELATSTELEKVVNQSGLEIQEGEMIKQSYLPFLNQLADINEQSKKIDFENPTELDEKISRDLRLKTTKIRTGAKSLKDDRKRIHLLKGNLEQSAYNLIEASCKLAEETFSNVEKAREIAEAKRKFELKLQREQEVIPYAEFIPQFINLGDLTNEDYAKLIDGAKLQIEARKQAEIKAELERVEKEKAEAERLRLEAIENERIRKENESLKAEQEKARIEAEKEKAKQQAILDAERKKADDLLEAQRKENERLKKIADEKLKAEQEAKAKLEAELKAKKDAEAKAEVDKLKAEKKAQNAPDKQKLIEFANMLNSISLPEVKSQDVEKILFDAKTLLEKTATFIKQKASEL